MDTNSWWQGRHACTSEGLGAWGVGVSMRRTCSRFVASAISPHVMSAPSDLHSLGVKNVTRCNASVHIASARIAKVNAQQPSNTQTAACSRKP